MKIGYRCMDNPAHSFKSKSKYMDGVSCPLCQLPVLPTGFEDNEYYKLPEYKDLKKQRRDSTDLVRMSSKTGIRILTTDEDRKMFLMSECQRLELDMILPPLTADVEFNLFEDTNEILVDTPKLVIEKITGKKVVNKF